MKVLLFLADGFEEVEALTVVDYLRRMDIVVDTVSITEDLKVKGAHNIQVTADIKIGDLKDLESYEAVIIPGGIPGATNLRDNSKVIDIINKLNEKKKLLAAICAGPIVLAEAGLINNINITSYPGFEKDLKDGNYREENVVRDGNVITSRGPALAVDFAIEIVDYLLGKEKVMELKEDILYKEN